MSSKRNKTNWWRPRFSVRTLAVLVTLVCCYVACWQPTLSHGISDVSRRYTSEVYPQTNNMPPAGGVRGRNISRHLPVPTARWPLIVAVDDAGMDKSGRISEVRRYYFWFFGYVAKLS